MQFGNELPIVVRIIGIAKVFDEKAPAEKRSCPLNTSRSVVSSRNHRILVLWSKKKVNCMRSHARCAKSAVEVIGVLPMSETYMG